MTIFNRVLGVFVLAATVATSAPAATPQQVANGFVDGVKVCLEASLLGVSVKDLPPAQKKLVTTAKEDGRFLVQGNNPAGPIWDVKSAAGYVIVSEAAAGDCEVVSYGPPVDATFKQAIKAIQTREPAFSDAGDKPDSYTPIRYGLVREADGTKIHIVLEGAEPGTVPGRYFRFSMLGARFRTTKP